MTTLYCGACGRVGTVGRNFSRTVVKTLPAPNGTLYDLRCACGERERIGTAPFTLVLDTKTTPRGRRRLA